jgi:hypothetical protein
LGNLTNVSLCRKREIALYEHGRKRRARRVLPLPAMTPFLSAEQVPLLHFLSITPVIDSASRLGNHSHNGRFTESPLQKNLCTFLCALCGIIRCLVLGLFFYQLNYSTTQLFNYIRVYLCKSVSNSGVRI